MTVEYARLGAAVECPHCLRLTVPEVPVGGTIPVCGYQLTYRDFMRLLEDHESRVAVAPLIADWFGFRVEQVDSDTLVQCGDGVPVDKLWLHLQIQSDSGRQYKLYQVAMPLCR